MKKNILLFILISFSIAISAQANLLRSGGITEELKDTIDNQLTVLSEFINQLQNDAESTFDPDSLSKVVGKNMEAYFDQVGFDRFKEQYASLLPDSIVETGQSKFSVFTFGYGSGGSAGFIPHSMIIKHDGDGSLCYNMSNEEASFYEFHQLKNNLYLCFATIPGWGACLNTGIYIIDFDDLSKVDRFSICNADVSYDIETKILTLYIEDASSYNVNDFREGTKIESDQENGSVTITTKFDGMRFVEP